MSYLKVETYTKGSCIADYSTTYLIPIKEVSNAKLKRLYRLCSEDFEMKSLYDVYATPSPTKERIWDMIRDVARKYGGQAAILTHNIHFFTAYVDIEDYYIVFTPTETFALPKQ